MESEDLDADFARTGNKRVDLEQQNANPNEKKQSQQAIIEAGKKIQLTTAHEKYIDRKNGFDKQYEQTLKNFGLNIDFLVHQQRLAQKLVDKIEDDTDATAYSIKKMNKNLDECQKNLVNVDLVVNEIKQRQAQGR